jgi:3-methyladenine DNA glycosylase AlkD
VEKLLTRQRCFTGMKSVVERVREELRASANEKTRLSFQRFFKEGVKCYGVQTPMVGRIAKKYWDEVKAYDKKAVFSLCEELYRSDYTEEAFVVSFWLPNLVDRLERSDLALFKVWIERYVNNWAKCDGFCNHTIGGLIEKYPDSVSELKGWAKSENKWLRRAVAVSLIIPAKKGGFLEDVFEISDALLSDEDDMVQKGYGWLLKEASRKHQKEVFNYVMKNRKIMPRTALRYAIELMPKDLKKEAIRRD